MSYWYENKTPEVGSMVVAEVQLIRETAVYCTLPAYGDCEVMLPTTEINVRRGKRVCDYVRVGQQIVVVVVRDDGDKFDVSMKQVREAEAAAIMEQYHRDAKIALLVRTATTDTKELEHTAVRSHASLERGEAMYRETIWPLATWCADGEEYRDVLSVFEDILAQTALIGDADRAIAALDLPVAIPYRLGAAIEEKVQVPSHTVEEEATMRFGTFHDGAARVSAELTRLAGMPGIQVFVVAPPKYRLTATAPTKARAAELLAAAMATVPEAC
jgi:translation initiation factor 2 alpha subunit (eIF-2alpha)